MTENDIFLYIGAGSDPAPLVRYPKIQSFIYVDVEDGVLFGRDGPHIYKVKQWQKIMRGRMMRKLEMTDLKIVKEKFTEHIWNIEFNTNQTIKYFFHDYPDEVTEEMQEVLDTCTILDNKGYLVKPYTLEAYKKLNNIHTYYVSGMTLSVYKKNPTCPYIKGELDYKIDLKEYFKDTDITISRRPCVKRMKK